MGDPDAGDLNIVRAAGRLPTLQREVGVPAAAADRWARHRAHPVGNAWRSQRSQRPSASRLHRRPRPGAQWVHRQRWAECHAAGELEHGPIALIEPGTPVIVIDEPGNRRLDGNIAEITARGARLIRIGADGASTFPVLGDVNGAPWGPLPALLPLQHLARRLARALGRDPDRPRNLAKSVTVE